MDSAKRVRALDPSASFIVEAPAGSGKTELLTQRFLTLLAHCEQPEEILAITFTRKAAAEMRHRVMSALTLAEQSEPEEAHRKFTWQLAQKALARNQKGRWQITLNPQRLQIYTFDSLCARIANTMPLQSRLGGMLDVTEDPQTLYELAVTRLFDSLEREGALQTALATLLRHRDNNFRDVKSLLISMLGKRDAWLPLLGGRAFESEQRTLLEENIQHLVDDELAKLDSMFTVSQRLELLALLQFAAQNLVQKGSPLADAFAAWLNVSAGEFPEAKASQLPMWQSLRVFLLTKDGGLRKKVTVKDGFPAEKGKAKELKDRMHNLLAELAQQTQLQQQLLVVGNLPSPRYPDSQWHVLNSLTRLLPVLSAQFKLVCAETGLLDFTEISQAALTALGSEDAPSDIAVRMDYQIQHLLVDEFQDTSTTQIQLLNRLTSEWQAGDGRSLFCVGDAMQSIYSFRNARVSLFLHCREYGLGKIPLEALQLNANFRSEKGIVEWNNRIFEQIFPRENDVTLAAVKYSPSTPVLPESEATAVEFFAYDQQNLGLEAKHIAQHISKIWQQDRDNCIAILLRKKAHALHILPALQEHALPYQAVDLEALSETTEVQDCLALTHALLDLEDRIAWLAILRAPWCGLDLHTLEAIASTRAHEENAIALPNVFEQLRLHHHINREAHNNEPLERVYKTLNSAWLTRQRLPLRDWIEGVWQALGGAACLQSEEARVNTATFFTTLEDLEQKFADTPTIKAIDEAVARLFAAPNPEADGRLQIMTIHKSKGLEFDSVFLPCLHSSKEPPDHALIQWQDRFRENGDQELLLAPLAAVTPDSEDALFNFLKSEKKRSKNFEDRRLLYVACTRAKKKLFLSGGLKRDSKDPSTAMAPSKNSFLAMLEPALSQHLILPPLNDTSRFETKAQVAVQRLPSRWTPPDLSLYMRLPDLIVENRFRNDEQILDLHYSDPSARHIGSLFHALVNRWIFPQRDKPLQQLHAKLVTDKTSFIQTWQHALLDLGVALHGTNDAAQKVFSLLDKSLMDENFQWLMSSTHELCLSEFALVSVSSSSLSKQNSLVLDLLLQDEKGQFWVVDFKTSEPHADQKTEAFLQEQSDVYRRKMYNYQRAVAELYSLRSPEQVKAALYFPAIATLSTYT